MIARGFDEIVTKTGVQPYDLLQFRDWHKPGKHYTCTSPEQMKSTILIVDDDPAVRSVARTALQRAGFEIIEADDGIEGLEILRNSASAISLLLTDVQMPRMEGVSLAASARKLFPRLPIVFMSGNADP